MPFFDIKFVSPSNFELKLPNEKIDNKLSKEGGGEEQYRYTLKRLGYRCHRLTRKKYLEIKINNSKILLSTS